MENDELANITITLNSKGQWVFDINGSNGDAQKLAYTIIAFARQELNKAPHCRNKITFKGEDLDLLH